VAYGKPEHLALHPFGKMPVLTDGEHKVFETLAILSWLDGAAAESRLFGTDRKTCADVLALASVAVDYAYRPVVHITVKDGEPDFDQMAEADRILDWLETRTQSGSFLTGEAITAADLIWAPMVAYHAKQVGSDRAYR